MFECKYHKKCPLYDTTSPTCQSNDAAKGYCGKRRAYENPEDLKPNSASGEKSGLVIIAKQR
jgi:hypothetical protein